VGRFSDDEIRRYSRQLVLPEVGGVGQERLRAATATAASEVEALYLAAAGVGAIIVGDAALAAAVRALDPGVRVTVDPSLPAASHDVEAAALRAWRTVKEALELWTSQGQ
jgi:adenylyltransferase/sulfurtransferase